MQTWQHLVLATPWRRLFLAAFGLSLVVAVLRGSVGTIAIVAVLRDRLWRMSERSVLTAINEDAMLCYVTYRRTTADAQNDHHWQP